MSSSSVCSFETAASHDKYLTNDKNYDNDNKECSETKSLEFYCIIPAPNMRNPPSAVKQYVANYHNCISNDVVVNYGNADKLKKKEIVEAVVQSLHYDKEGNYYNVYRIKEFNKGKTFDKINNEVVEVVDNDLSDFIRKRIKKIKSNLKQKQKSNVKDELLLEKTSKRQKCEVKDPVDMSEVRDKISNDKNLQLSVAENKKEVADGRYNIMKDKYLQLSFDDNKKEGFFKFEDVDGDGNCFFRSLCKHKCFEIYNHVTLRQEFVTRIEKWRSSNNDTKKMHYKVISESYQKNKGFDMYDYVTQKKICEDKVFTGSPIIIPMMYLFDVNIYIHFRYKVEENNIINQYIDVNEYSFWKQVNKKMKEQGDDMLQIPTQDVNRTVHILSHKFKNPFYYDNGSIRDHFGFLRPQFLYCSKNIIVRKTIKNKCDVVSDDELIDSIYSI